MREHTQPPLVPRPPTLGGGRYVVTRRIGQGGSAGVYLVYDQHLEQWRAAKVLHHRFVHEEELRWRFLREARSMARLDHPNIVRVLDVIDAPQPYMIMEYVGGGGVLGWLQQHGALPPATSVQVMIDVARALVAVHDARIVHRDIKPHNLLVTVGGQIKLTDFGIAKVDRGDLARVADTEVTSEGELMGSEAFMAPEQRRDAATVGPSADLFSAGATLYALCTRRAVANLWAVEAGDVQLQPVPPPLRPLVLRACRERPRDRFADARELLQALEEVHASLPPAAPGIPPLARPVHLPALPPERLDDGVILDLMDLTTDAGPTGALAERVAARRAAVNSDSSLDVRPRVQSVDEILPTATWVASLLTVLGFAAMAVVMGAGVAAWGAYRVNVARVEHAAAYAAWIHEVDEHRGVMGALVEAGADPEPLHASWKGYQEAEPYTRGRAALGFVDSLGKANRSLEAPIDHADIEALAQSGRAWLEAHRAWVASAEGPGGRLAIVTGLASRPVMPE